MARKVSYAFYKGVMLAVWALAILCVIATWVVFSIPNMGANIFGIVVDALLTLVLISLIVLLALNERQDYKKRAWLFAVFTALHLAFFILVIIFRNQIAEGNAIVYVYPAIHTAILIVISIVGIYFWIRNKFKFKSFAQQDAIEAFGGPIEEPKAPEQPQPVASLEPEEPKKARDEKTGIVSL